jgi:hypothetical protein
MCRVLSVQDALPGIVLERQRRLSNAALAIQRPLIDPSGARHPRRAEDLSLQPTACKTIMGEAAAARQRGALAKSGSKEST